MSRNHTAVAHEVTHIIHDIQQMGIDKAWTVYGIQFLEDSLNGPVFDPTYNRTFVSLGEWANFSVEQDSVADHESFHKHEEDYF